MQTTPVCNKEESLLHFSLCAYLLGLTGFFYPPFPSHALATPLRLLDNQEELKKVNAGATAICPCRKWLLAPPVGYPRDDGKELGEKDFVVKLGQCPFSLSLLELSFRGLGLAAIHGSCKGDRCSSLLEQPGSRSSSAGGCHMHMLARSSTIYKCLNK